MRILKNQKGLSLVGVMVAAGISSIIMMSILTVISDMYKSEIRLKDFSDIRAMRTEFAEVVKAPNCGIVDLNTPIDILDSEWPSSVTYELSEGINSGFLQLNVGSEYDRFEITDIDIGPYQDKTDYSYEYYAIGGDDEKDFENATAVRASLRFFITLNERELHPVQVPIYLSISQEDQTIIGCRPDNQLDMLQLACASMNGSWNSQTTVCSLPCPVGFSKSQPNDDRCYPTNSTQTNTCAQNESCGVDSRFIL